MPYGVYRSSSCSTVEQFTFFHGMWSERGEVRRRAKKVQIQLLNDYRKIKCMRWTNVLQDVDVLI